MPATAKMHPADAHDEAIFERAVEFTAYQRSPKTVVRCQTFAQALGAYVDLIADGGKALIYAIDADGRQAVVTRARIREALKSLENPREDDMTEQTYSTKFAAKRAAQRAGITDPDIVQKDNGRFTYIPDRGQPEVARAAELLDEVSEPTTVEQIKPKAKPQKTPVAEAAAPHFTGKYREQAEAAAQGKLPEPPDFSAPTHARFRKKLDALVDMAKAGDTEGLKAVQINPVSSSPKAMARYRDLCVIALEAQAGKAA